MCMRLMLNNKFLMHHLVYIYNIINNKLKKRRKLNRKILDTR